jgi:HEAT repeat protein
MRHLLPIAAALAAVTAVVAGLLSRSPAPGEVPAETPEAAAASTANGARLVGAGRAPQEIVPVGPGTHVEEARRLAAKPETARDVARLAAADPRVAADLVALLHHAWDPQRKDRYERGTTGSTRVPATVPTLEGIAAALRSIGPPALDALLAAVASEDETLRIRAVWVLGAMGDDATPAVDAILRMARDEREAPHARAAAVRALGALGPRAAAAGPFVAALVQDEETPEPLAIAAAGAAWPILGDGPAGVTAVRVFERQWVDACGALLAALEADAGRASVLLPSLLELLEAVQQDGAIEGRAIAAIGAVARDDPKAVDVLRALVANEERSDAVRRAAADALGRSGERGRAVLVEEATRGTTSVRMLVFDALVGPNGEPEPAITRALVRGLPDVEDRDLHEVLARVAPAATGEMLPPVVAGLERLADRHAASAMDFVAGLPEPSEAAARLAGRFLAHDALEVRRQALRAVSKHAARAPEDVVPAIRRLLDGSETFWAAVHALTVVGPVRAASALPDLERARDRVRDDPRMLAALDEAIAKLRPR